MRVLHVLATGDRRGAEMFASDLIRYLNTSGIEQRVAVIHGGEPVAAGYEAPRIFLGANGRGAPGLRMDLASIRRLRRALATFRPDLIHAHGGEPFKYSLFASPGGRPPILYRRIGEFPDFATRGLRRFGHATLMRRSHRIVAVAEAIRQETLRTFGVPADKVVTIPRGVDPERTDPKAGRSATRGVLGIAPEAPVMLSLGALTAEKAPLTHVAVAERIHRTLPTLRHLVAGDGPLRADVEAAARERGLADVVMTLGNRADVGDLLAASDVMLLASIREGMPGCLIEAGIAGLPVVASDVAGVPEVVEDGVTGAVVPAGDVEALADRATEILTDPNLRARLGDAAKVRCREAFAIDRVAARYVEVYREMTA
jgi:glycosyltransferase involved in cell wall biosynthesis